MKTIFVDCDDTLVFWHPNRDEEDIVVSSDGHALLPNRTLVNNLKRCIANGDKVIVWSAGGEDWAREVTELVGLHLSGVICLSKPNIIVDDLPFTCWMPSNRIAPKKSWELVVKEKE